MQIPSTGAVVSHSAVDMARTTARVGDCVVSCDPTSARSPSSLVANAVARYPAGWERTRSSAEARFPGCAQPSRVVRLTVAAARGGPCHGSGAGLSRRALERLRRGSPDAAGSPDLGQRASRFAPEGVTGPGGSRGRIRGRAAASAVCWSPRQRRSGHKRPRLVEFGAPSSLGAQGEGPAER
jgi:hypothetical protein